MKFYNLTDGLEFVPDGTPPADVRLVRIQSTACEQKRWSFILEDLDYSFLAALAVGHVVVVVDGSASGGEARALWQGLPWIKYACEQSWFGIAETPKVRGHDVSRYFAAEYSVLGKTARNKLRYFRKFVGCKRLSLQGEGHATLNDGDYVWYTRQFGRVFSPAT